MRLTPVEVLRAGGDKKKDNHQIDHLEGADRYFSKNDVELTMTPNLSGPPLKIKALNLTYTVKNTLIAGNIASFYSVTDLSFSAGKFNPIDPRMTEFGTHALLITNVDEFINRIRKAIPKETWLSLSYGNVEYFDEKDFADNLHLFLKRSLYSYQKEFRVFIESGELSPLELDLGPLGDIAVVVPAEATLHLNFKHNADLQAVELDFHSKNVMAGKGGFRKKPFLQRLFHILKKWLVGY